MYIILNNSTTNIISDYVFYIIRILNNYIPNVII